MLIAPSWSAVMGWLEDPAEHIGVNFSRRDGWAWHSYASLACQARQVAWRLHEQGIRRGDTTIVIQDTSPEFVAAFFGSMLIGAAPAPITPKAALDADDDYTDYLARVLRTTRARAILTEPESARSVRTLAGTAHCVLDDLGEADGPAYQGSGVPADLAFLQFSSGSRGFPRAVRVPYSALAADVEALEEWLRGDPAVDGTASWLPLHHDMGLVGCFIGPIMRMASLWLMRPEEFIRSPLHWLRCFGQNGATFSAIPNFGLRHIVRRVRPEMLDGMDFSAWRALIVGAERVDPRAIEELVELLGPAGFPPKAISPAYGMAEAVLAVTAVPVSEAVRTVRVDTTRLVPGEPVTRSEDADSESCVEVVSCGRPLHGVEVAIVGDDLRPLPEGVLGQIQVSGETVTDGYLTLEDDAPPVRFEGVFPTGDAGFMLDGDLYVVGRNGDSVKCLGRWLYAEDVEDIAARVAPADLRPVVVLGSTLGASTALVLVNRRAADFAARIGQAVTETFPGLHALVIVVRPGEVLRTTSGKPRRSLIWQSLTAGSPAERVAWDSRSAMATENIR